MCFKLLERFERVDVRIGVIKTNNISNSDKVVVTSKMITEASTVSFEILQKKKKRNLLEEMSRLTYNTCKTLTGIGHPTVCSISPG